MQQFSNYFSQVVISSMSNMLEDSSIEDKEVTLTVAAGLDKWRFNYGPGM